MWKYNVNKFTISLLARFIVPCGLVARIRRSHRRGRGSIPRTGVYLNHYSLHLKRINERNDLYLPMLCSRMKNASTVTVLVKLFNCLTGRL